MAGSSRGDMGEGFPYAKSSSSLSFLDRRESLRLPSRSEPLPSSSSYLRLYFWGKYLRGSSSLPPSSEPDYSSESSNFAQAVDEVTDEDGYVIARSASKTVQGGLGKRGLEGGQNEISESASKRLREAAERKFFIAI